MVSGVGQVKTRCRQPAYHVAVDKCEHLQQVTHTYHPESRFCLWDPTWLGGHAQASTITTGVRWTGKHLRGENGRGWRAEFARQREHADNPLRFAHEYWRIEPSLTRHGVTWRAGWGHLGGDGSHALQTPLATLHAFNGAADKFLVTPPGGLEDRFVGAGGALGSGALADMKWTLAWHDFRADSGGDYGSEWDASLAFPVRGKLTGLVKLADYRSAGFARDTTKVWVQLEWAR